MPTNPTVLTRVYLTHENRWSVVRKRSARFWIFGPGSDGEIECRERTANDDGLFDVPELGLVSNEAA